MILYPAIDLKDGQCVRLLRGEMSAATVFGDDPAAQAARIPSTYPNRVGLTTFPFQTYKGSLNFPNLGLFFNLGC